MTETTTNAPKEALGVGAIVSESFSILFKNFVMVVMLGFIPTMIGLIASGLLMGWSVAFGSADPDFLAQGSVLGFVIATLIQIAAYGVTIALLVLMAYDAKLGRSLTPARYVKPALSSFIVIAIVTLIVSVVVGVAAIALIVPGLWAYAVFSVVIPAIVIERAGFGAMSRSAELTKEYRWPVLGALILIMICTGLLSFVSLFIFGMVSSVLGSGIVSIVIGLVALSALYAIAYGLSSISIALIYARLREIKEGVSVDNLASVFE